MILIFDFNSPCRVGGRGEGLAGLNVLTGYAGGNFLFLVGPPKPDRPYEGGLTRRDKLVLQELGFCGWIDNPPKENKVLLSKDAQPWTKHLERMENTRLPKHALSYKPRGRRDRGSPRK